MMRGLRRGQEKKGREETRRYPLQLVIHDDDDECENDESRI